MHKIMVKKMNFKDIFFSTLKYAILIFLLFVFVIPVLVIFFAAFKTNKEYATTSVLTLPTSFFDFKNFITAFVDGHMLTGFKNTIIIMIFSLAGSVLTGSMSAFIFSRFKSQISKSQIFCF